MKVDMCRDIIPCAYKTDEMLIFSDCRDFVWLVIKTDIETIYFPFHDFKSKGV